MEFVLFFLSFSASSTRKTKDERRVTVNENVNANRKAGVDLNFDLSMVTQSTTLSMDLP